MKRNRDSDSDKPWYIRIKQGPWYDRIKQTPWKVPVLDRLYRVEEDVRRAISAVGWTLRDGGEVPVVCPPPGHGRSPLMDEADAVVRATFEFINKAGQSLDPPAPWWRRYWDELAKESLMPAYINLHAAETSRVRLLSGDQLMAILPSIRQRVAAYLEVGDPRRVALDGVPDLTAVAPQTLTRMRDELVRSVTAASSPRQARRMRLLPRKRGKAVTSGPAQAAEPAPDQALGITKLTDMLGRDQQIAAEAMGEACKAEDQQQFQVSRFRRVLLGTFASLFVLVVFTGIAGNIEPAYFPLCLQEMDNKALMICPTGGHTPSGADLPLILGLGALGAALAVATSLAGQKPVVGVRYSLSVAQGLVKVIFGAIIAVLGIIILGTQTSDVPGILGTQAGLLSAAVVFGYSQQLFTRAIDRQATSLLAAASPATPPGGKDTASIKVSGIP